MAAHFTLLVGSVLGASEYVAEAVAKVLEDKGASVDLQLEPDFDSIQPGSTWIICTSTHGAGDFPDNIEPFTKVLANADLSAVNTYIIGLGDSSYDTFCFAAMNMEKLLLARGATLLAPALHIDVLNHPIPEDTAIEWAQQTIEVN